MGNDDNRSSRRTPPESEEDWLYIWTGIHYSHQGWKVVGPIVAAVTNWKAWVVIAGIVAWIRGPEIMAAILTVLEAVK